MQRWGWYGSTTNFKIQFIQQKELTAKFRIEHASLGGGVVVEQTYTFNLLSKSNKHHGLALSMQP